MVDVCIKIRISVDQRENKEFSHVTFSDIPLIKGTPNIDLKMQPARLVHRTGLTAWTEAGRQFIADHILVLPSVKINDCTIWLSDGDVNPVQVAMIKKRLRCVVGFGPEPYFYDEEGLDGWGYHPETLRYENENARASAKTRKLKQAHMHLTRNSKRSG